MKLDNFRAALSQILPSHIDQEIVIPIQRAGTIGGQNYVKITSVQVGFDWDSGKIFINPEKKLRIIEDDELRELREEVEKIGWTEYENRNLKREITKLRTKIKELENDQ